MYGECDRYPPNPLSEMSGYEQCITVVGLFMCLLVAIEVIAAMLGIHL